MSNLNTEIEKYVESKRDSWSDRTLPVVRSILLTLAPHFTSPYRNYKELIKDGFSKHTIRTYFLYAIRFEEETRKTTLYRDYLRRNKAAFKNCYLEKTRLLKPAQFEKFKAQHITSNPKMYNLLVLMGEAGLRVSEAMNAKWSDFVEGDDAYSFIRVIGKGNKQRLVPFDKNRLIKIQESGEMIVGVLAYKFLFQRDLKPFTPHDFRAHYATVMTQTYPELSVKDLAQLLGHSSIVTTQKYMRFDLNRVAKVLNKKK